MAMALTGGADSRLVVWRAQAGDDSSDAGGIGGSGISGGGTTSGKPRLRAMCDLTVTPTCPIITLGCVSGGPSDWAIAGTRDGAMVIVEVRATPPPPPSQPQPAQVLVSVAGALGSETERLDVTSAAAAAATAVGGDRNAVDPALLLVPLARVQCGLTPVRALCGGTVGGDGSSGSCWIASGSDDGHVRWWRVWDGAVGSAAAASGAWVTQVAQLRAHSDYVATMAAAAVTAEGGATAAATGIAWPPVRGTESSRSGSSIRSSPSRSMDGDGDTLMSSAPGRGDSSGSGGIDAPASSTMAEAGGGAAEAAGSSGADATGAGETAAAGPSDASASGGKLCPPCGGATRVGVCCGEVSVGCC